MEYAYEVKTSYCSKIKTGGVIKFNTPQKAIEQIKKEHTYLVDTSDKLKSICLFELTKYHLVYIVLFGEKVC